MKAAKKTAAKSSFPIIALTLLFLFCPGAVRAQYLIVDCTGADPSASQVSMRRCRTQLPAASFW